MEGDVAAHNDNDDADRLWPPAFKAAIFDFDGTISDTAALWRQIDEAFLGSRGIECPKDYSRTLSALGFAAGARYTIERFGLSETTQEICDEWNQMGRTLYESNVKLRPGAENYIFALHRQGIPVALATTNDRDVLDAMRHVDVNSLFDVRVHTGELGLAKDRPEVYLDTAQRLGIRPEECIVFEDLTVAVRSAQATGMATCGIRSNDPTQDVSELRAVSDLWLDDWQDIDVDPS